MIMGIKNEKATCLSDYASGTQTQWGFIKLLTKRREYDHIIEILDTRNNWTYGLSRASCMQRQIYRAPGAEDMNESLWNEAYRALEGYVKAHTAMTEKDFAAMVDKTGMIDVFAKSLDIKCMDNSITFHKNIYMECCTIYKLTGKASIHTACGCIIVLMEDESSIKGTTQNSCKNEMPNTILSMSGHARINCVQGTMIGEMSGNASITTIKDTGTIINKLGKGCRIAVPSHGNTVILAQAGSKIGERLIKEDTPMIHL